MFVSSDHNPPRGAFPVCMTSTGNTIICVFGNDGISDNPIAQCEFKLLEQYLAHAGLSKVAAGLSRDLHSWALLVEVEVPAFNTTVGRAFHIEMVRACLEELVERAWRDASRAAITEVLAMNRVS